MFCMIPDASLSGGPELFLRLNSRGDTGHSSESVLNHMIGSGLYVHTGNTNKSHFEVQICWHAPVEDRHRGVSLPLQMTRRLM